MKKDLTAENAKKAQSQLPKMERMITNFNVGENFWCANEQMGDHVKCMAQCNNCKVDKRIHGC